MEDPYILMAFFFFFYHNGFLIDHSPKSYIALRKKKKVNWKNVYENFYVNRLLSIEIEKKSCKYILQLETTTYFIILCLTKTKMIHVLHTSK